MMGRPPKSVEQRRLDGTLDRTSLEPILIGGRPELVELIEPPPELETQPDAQAWWRDVVPQLAAAGLLDRVDRTILVSAAEAWQHVRRLRAVERSEGYFDGGSRGQIRLAPWTRALGEWTDRYERLIQHLGLSPTARARLGLAHLKGRTMAAELEVLIGSSEDAIEGEVIADDELVGLPGV